eukprot:gnl/Dysnectes_brevis/4296_a5701_937.p1 GENE.gnl/Dysnectes_brevis/4296_a5701_937~~gnl/Dysnectes_brevis/4296_a5701_937.p1  ORF type:complete len:770 (+),score=175.15 gnl/Dysnectes_brevis/4296_a5701_937:70-2379(+)
MQSSTERIPSDVAALAEGRSAMAERSEPSNSHQSEVELLSSPVYDVEPPVTQNRPRNSTNAGWRKALGFRACLSAGTCCMHTFTVVFCLGLSVIIFVPPLFGVFIWGALPLVFKVIGFILYSIMLANYLFNYIMCVLTGPGSPPPHVETVEQGQDFDRCPKCERARPLRTHHCSICNKCVLKMDHHCYAHGTEVFMSDGSISVVEDLKVGDLLLGPDAAPQAIQVIMTGAKNMYRLHKLSRAGTVISSTDITHSHILRLVSVSADSITHPALTEYRVGANEPPVPDPATPYYIEIPADAWVALPIPDDVRASFQLQEFAAVHPGSGDDRELVVNVPYGNADLVTDPAAFTVTITEDMAHFLGLWLGDGDCNGASIACGRNPGGEVANRKDVLDALLTRVASQILPGLAVTSTSGVHSITGEDGHGYHSAVHRFIRAAGFATEETGLDGAFSHKRIPSSIHAWPPALRLRLLAGLFDAAGTDEGNGSFSICPDTLDKGELDLLEPQVKKLCILLGFSFSCRHAGRGWVFTTFTNTKLTPFNATLLYGKRVSGVSSGGCSFTLTPLAGPRPYVGFDLPASSDHLHVLADGTVSHNCPWVGGCVGFRNHGYFLLFLGFATFGSLISTIITAIGMVTGTLFSTCPLAAGTTLAAMGGIFGVAMGISGVVAAGMMFIVHYKLLSTGQTTLEEYGNKLASQQASLEGVEYHIPFDLGKHRNLVAALGDNRPLWKTVLFPNVVTPVGDGMSWEFWDGDDGHEQRSPDSGISQRKYE